MNDNISKRKALIQSLISIFSPVLLVILWLPIVFASSGKNHCNLVLEYGAFYWLHIGFAVGMIAGIKGMRTAFCLRNAEKKLWSIICLSIIGVVLNSFWLILFILSKLGPI